MMASLLVWLLSSAAVFLALLAGRRARLHRRLGLGDLDWKSVLVLSLLLGALPAFVYDQTRHTSVIVDVDPAIPAAPPR